MQPGLMTRLKSLRNGMRSQVWEWAGKGRLAHRALSPRALRSGRGPIKSDYSSLLSSASVSGAGSGPALAPAVRLVTA